MSSKGVMAGAIAALVVSVDIGARQPVEFGAYPDGRQAEYRRVMTRSVYVQMRDGVRLAVDVLLPADLPPAAKLPTIVRWTRYWRSRADQPQISTLDRFFVTHGYARVLVDERGTGASFGIERYGRQNLDDARQIVDWIVAQAWSNGRVGALGDSYEGGAGEMLAATGHPGVRAVIPRFTSFDEFSNMMPGGILVEPLLQAWSNGNRRLDEGEGVKRVDEDKEGRLLQQAVRDHARNPDVVAAARRVSYRDDDVAGFDRTAEGLSTGVLKDQIEGSGAAILAWGGWHDADSADAVIQRFSRLKNTCFAVIGPWNHLGSQHASPWSGPEAVVAPSPMQQWSEFLRFFDRFLLREEVPCSERRLLYYTMGEEAWKTTTSWPPEGSSRQRWYLTPGRELVESPQAAGLLKHVPDPDASTGRQNRWWTGLGGRVRYTDLQDRRLALVTAPLGRDLEVTGSVRLTLRMTCSTEDASVFSYLEDIAPDGTVRYITEGQLRLLHRTTRSFLRKDGTDVKPGQWMDVTLDLLPTSVRIARGHRLRLSLAGFDKDTFTRIPANGTPRFEFSVGTDSFLDLPVLKATTTAAPVVIASTLPDPFKLAGYRGRYEAATAGGFEVNTDYDQLLVTAIGQSALEQFVKSDVKESGRAAARDATASSVAEGLMRGDLEPARRAMHWLTRLGFAVSGGAAELVHRQWQQSEASVGRITSFEIVGTGPAPPPGRGTWTYILLHGTRGAEVMSLIWNDDRIVAWGRPLTFPAVRRFAVDPNGGFVSVEPEPPRLHVSIANRRIVVSPVEANRP